MDYNQVQIQKVDNGFVVSTTKVIFGDPRPEQTINVFKTFEEVIGYLSPAKVKLEGVK
jgi:hypothetical protein